MARKKIRDIRTYPAILTKDENGIAVEFPDLPGCVTCGSTGEEAVDRAKEALEGFLFVSERDGDFVPAPTPFEKIRVEEGQAVVLITVRMDIVREEEARRSVTKSVTLPAWLNQLGMEHNLNFSSLLQEALKERLDVREPASF
ncbi:MAG: type II toxin-antitoxin system HicB family antitoxin [Aminivibrio sp.]|jgi:predicted RNase H-like HicB family nuclease|nr:hypothetical protein [Synergistaceae bacterium]